VRNQEIKVKIINTSNLPNPEYVTEGAAGMDIKACIDQAIVLKPLQRKAVPTGIFVEIPSGFEIQIRPRSGMALNHGITCLNSPGTIDSDYRGEIKVILANLSDTEYIIQNGDRIAQMVLASVEKLTWENVTEINESNRGSGGFGHTGK
jgi:dUTP pyrophosphatase